jgi:hypothetical protein
VTWAVETLAVEVAVTWAAETLAVGGVEAMVEATEAEAWKVEEGTGLVERQGEVEKAGPEE